MKQDTETTKPSFTPGPWRWEYSPKRKTASLLGGTPKFDKTVMDFSRVGIGHAGPLFNNQESTPYLERLCDKSDKWCKPFPGREHHAHWLLSVDHPDANLIAAAPEMYAALQACHEAMAYMSEYDIPITLPDQVKAALAKARGEHE